MLSVLGHDETVREELEQLSPERRRASPTVRALLALTCRNLGLSDEAERIRAQAGFATAEAAQLWRVCDTFRALEGGQSPLAPALGGAPSLRGALLVEQAANALVVRGEPRRAIALVQDSLAHALTNDEALSLHVHRWVLANLELLSGQLRRGQARLTLLEQAAARTQRIHPNQRGALLTVRAAALLEELDVDAAAATLAAARQLLCETTEPRFSGMLALCEFRLGVLRGRAADAQLALERCRSIARSAELPGLALRGQVLQELLTPNLSLRAKLVCSERADMALARGVPSLAFRPDQAKLLLGHRALRAGRLDDAKQIAVELVERASREQRLICEVEGRLLELMACAAHHRYTKLPARLGAQLLELAAPERIFAPFLLAPDKLRIHLRELAAALGEPLAAQRLARARAPNRCEVDVSPREREVLRQVAAGASNADAARALGVSACTVKKHLENIYRKWGVDNRMQATSLARELGWL